MKKRVVTKIGDIFSVSIDKSRKKFFQLVAFDRTQLNSDVIRGFKKDFPIEKTPTMGEIVKGEVQFYAHCTVKLGVKLGHWEKVGKFDDVGEVNDIIFKGTEDYATMPGQKPITVSENWYIWRIGDLDFTDVGKLEGENREAYIGLVINPLGIIELLKGNKYPPFYPDFT